MAIFKGTMDELIIIIFHLNCQGISERGDLNYALAIISLYHAPSIMLKTTLFHYNYSVVSVT